MKTIKVKEFVVPGDYDDEGADYERRQLAPGLNLIN